MNSSAWDRYSAWNEHLAEVVYPVLDNVAPAYLDLEEEQVAALGAQMGVDVDRVIPELAGAVVATLDQSTAAAFAPHYRLLRQWRAGNRQTPPPVLPLLAVFSLAAERMSADESMSAQNYYGRLVELLPGDRSRLERSYQRHAEFLWDGLNSWLTALDGTRGTPTAYSVGMRYVGLSISQALVREADRRRLIDFFVQFGFAPASRVAPHELESYLDAWIAGGDPSPAGSNLARLWARNALRPRIAEIAATELEEWNGEGASGAPGARREPVLLTLGLPSFSRRRLELTPLFFTRSPDPQVVARMATSHGDVEVELSPAGEGAAALPPEFRLDNADALEGVITVTVGDRQLQRRPKRLVVFRKSALMQRWVETEQVLLGDELLALVVDRFAEALRATLAEIARPGWVERTDIDGLPPGWILIERLEVFARLPKVGNSISELGALLPMTSSQLKFEGGLRLAGRIRNRWHTACPPEIRAISDAGDPFELRLWDRSSINDEPLELDAWPDHSAGSIVIDLATAELEDGDYEVEMVRGAKVALRTQFSLRSSASADPSMWDEIETVAHDLALPLAVLCADEPDDSETQRLLQVASFGDSVTADPVLASAPTDHWWTSARSASARSTLQIARPEAGSCFYTGAHHEEFPKQQVDRRGRPVEVAQTGRCRYCGLERRYSNDYWANRRRYERRLEQQLQTGGPRVDLTHLPVSPEPSLTLYWAAALDALRFLGGGDGASLEFLARQLDASAFSSAGFSRTLENLGHIEVRRDVRNREVVAWEIGPTLALGREGGIALCGYITQAIVDALAGAAGHAPTTQTNPDGSQVMLLQTDHPENVIEESGVSVFLVERPGWEIARRLPPLSHVVAALPPTHMPAIAMQWFNVTSTSWQDVASVERPGAYRTTGFSRSYLFRSAKHVADGTAVAADFALVKHAAAQELAGRPLAAYAPVSRTLVTPIGAELPGLYERAVVLESGRIPVVHKDHVLYQEVPADLAALVTSLIAA